MILQFSMHGLDELSYPITPVTIIKTLLLMEPSTTVWPLINFYLYLDIFYVRGSFKAEDIYQHHLIHASWGTRPVPTTISIDELGLQQYMNWFTSTPAVEYRPWQTLSFVLQQIFSAKWFILDQNWMQTSYSLYQ